MIGYSCEGLLKFFVIFLKESIDCSYCFIISVLVMLSFCVLDLFALMDFQGCIDILGVPVTNKCILF